MRYQTVEGFPRRPRRQPCVLGLRGSWRLLLRRVRGPDAPGRVVRRRLWTGSCWPVARGHDESRLFEELPLPAQAAEWGRVQRTRIMDEQGDTPPMAVLPHERGYYLTSRRSQNFAPLIPPPSLAIPSQDRAYLGSIAMIHLGDAVRTDLPNDDTARALAR